MRPGPTDPRHVTAEASDKIAPGPIHLAPVLTTLAFAWGFTLLLSVFDLSLPRPILAPFEKPEGGYVAPPLAVRFFEGK